MLRKDFIYEPYQVVESRALGADCILIIMAAVDDAAAKTIEDAAFANGHGRACLKFIKKMNLSARLQLRSRLIGINNRDLRTFETSLAVSERLAPQNPARPHRGRPKAGSTRRPTSPASRASAFAPSWSAKA